MQAAGNTSALTINPASINILNVNESNGVSQSPSDKAKPIAELEVSTTARIVSASLQPSVVSGSSVFTSNLSQSSSLIAFVNQADADSDAVKDNKEDVAAPEDNKRKLKVTPSRKVIPQSRVAANENVRKTLSSSRVARNFVN